jgi:hypothetical protein
MENKENKEEIKQEVKEEVKEVEGINEKVREEPLRPKKSFTEKFKIAKIDSEFYKTACKK